jgi:FkbM family methyltransferase
MGRQPSLSRTGIAKIANYFVEGVLVAWASKSHKWWQRLKYSRFPTGHVFRIVIDDFEYEMTFGDHPISNAIVQRIEGRREPETMAIYRSLIRPGNKILEIGSCYGEFTILMAHCAGPTGKVVAIEGTPNNFKLFQENLRLNNVLNVDAYNLFVSMGGCEARFGVGDTHPYNAIDLLKCHARAKNEGEQIIVPTVRPTEFLRRLGFVPDLIFMDIEGFEVDVFEDFSNNDYLKSHQPTILFEIHDSFYDPGRDYRFISTGLEEAGYACRRIGGNALCFPVKRTRT